MRRWRWVLSTTRGAGLAALNLWGNGEGAPAPAIAGRGDGRGYQDGLAGLQSGGAGHGWMTDDEGNLNGDGEGWWHDSVAVAEVKP